MGWCVGNLISTVNIILNAILVDIDECTESGNVTCQENAHCNNTLGSYECVCSEGYDMVDDKCEGELPYSEINVYYNNYVNSIVLARY